MKNRFYSKSYIAILVLSFYWGVPSPAAMLDYLSPADPLKGQTFKESIHDTVYPVQAQKAKLTKNDVHNHYEIAKQRFMQSNVKSAYKDFQMMIQHIVPNDYAYIKIADEMAEMGLFNLSNMAIDKAYDKDIAYVQSEDIKKFFFPKVMLLPDDEVYLAEVYSNILYNAQSKEATAELIKNTDLMSKYDYANYIAALGFLKSGNSVAAVKYINNALKMNQENINYQKLKIEIDLEAEDIKNARHILDNIKKEKFYTIAYQNRVDTLEQFTLYRTEKDDIMKKYYLAKYYCCLGDYVKASRTLISAVSNKKKQNRLVYGLLSEVYYQQKEYEKALNFAQKALQLGGNNIDAMLVMGKLSYDGGKYQDALKYFKTVSSNDNMSSLLWLAQSYTALNNDKQAKEIYYRILKDHADCPQAYYNIAIRDKDRETQYLKKAIAANVGYVNAWIGLVASAYENNNISLMSKYLEIVKYIDENDFRYYYYQGLVYKAKGLLQDANYYFKKSYALNPDSEMTKKELGI